MQCAALLFLPSRVGRVSVGATGVLGRPDYERIPGDFYITEAPYTRALLRHVRFRPGGIYEPACGEGDISRVLLEHGHDVVSTDLVHRNPGIPFSAGVDFLSLPCMPYEGTSNHLRHIITNPPYRDGLDMAFIRRALKLTKRGQGQVAMFLPFTFDASDHHREVIDDCPIFAAKITCHERPRLVRGTTGSPRQYFAWYVWDWLHWGNPVFAWVHVK